MCAFQIVSGLRKNDLCIFFLSNACKIDFIILNPVLTETLWGGLCFLTDISLFSTKVLPMGSVNYVIHQYGRQMATLQLLR